MLNSLIGIIASSGAGGAGAGGDYESIATVNVGLLGASSITFSSIPSTYKHLQVRSMALGTGFAFSDITFNSDFSTNYSYHQITGDGASVTAAGGANTTLIYALQGASSATLPAVGIIDILDYKDTNKFKTIRCLTGYDKNGSGEVYLRSGAWRSTSAITTLQITANTSFAQYSSFALYGIKG